MTDKLLDALARFCLRRSRLILLGALVLAVLAVAAASRLTFDPDLLDLFLANLGQFTRLKEELRDPEDIQEPVLEALEQALM